jgi:hypothetical protein
MLSVLPEPIFRTVPVPSKVRVREPAGVEGLKVTVEFPEIVNEAQLTEALNVIAAELLIITSSVAVGIAAGNPDQFAAVFQLPEAPPIQVFCAMAVPPMSSSAIKNKGIGNFR